MEGFLLYLLKCSIAVATLTIFYGVLLRKMTFYHANRFYLIGAVCLAMILPLVDITVFMSGKSAATPGVIDSIPTVANITISASGNSGLSTAMLIFLAWMICTAVLLIRLVIQFVTLLRLKRHSTLLYEYNGMKVLDAGHGMSPFTFGSNVFVHRAMFSDDELKIINSHESVHVRGRHTFDIILSEAICVLMWFNPFAWMLRKYIRQNLEFIADESVMDEGSDRRHYQYLLVKTSAGVPYMPVSTFSAQNLKKRIVMINTSKSSKSQLLKFVIVIPVLLFMSVMFRNDQIIAQSSSPITIFSESGIKIENDTNKDKPLYIVDEWPQPASFKIDYLKQQDIISVTVWKGQQAVKKFGPTAAANGAIEVTTKLPLYVVDGIVQMKTSNADDLVKTDDIASMNVLKGKSGTQKYGRRNDNGVIEITTKKKLK
ncbi:MAG: hypothetical protein JNK79_12285 [Chitinophagaceae bacterium]|nr:hypothetical protein [Chitinophagaceae bacterium]